MPGAADWDKRFMLLAHHIAHWSRERGRRVGAVVVGPDNEIRATGHNGFPRGVNDELEHRHSKETGDKYFWSSHAEQNAVFNAARVGVPLKGCRIYVPWFPCGECSKAIIQSGINELVAYEPDLSDEKWGHDFRRVVEMLGEAGVRVRFMDRLAEIPDGRKEKK
jgi:dCMP deaminase